jgi:hypothetical protein
MEYGHIWNPETNDFVPFTVDEYVAEQSEQLAFWSAVAKHAKKTHKKFKADSWVKYHESEIRNAREYEEWSKNAVR